jgi:cell division protein FtsL
MISQRAAVLGGRPAAVRTRTSWRQRLSARPAVAGRERIAEALGRSVVIQLMLAMSFVAVAGLLYMAQAGQVSVQQINIDILRSNRVQLVSENTSLSLRATNLTSLQRVDSMATSQLHMALPSRANAIWVWPAFHHITVVRPVDADTANAQRASQPLAWMVHAIRLVKSSL